MTIKLDETFGADVKIAYEYWKSKQESEVQEKVTLEKWITSILQKPVYDFIGQKRIEEA